jgi:hypothetical protein
MGVAPAIVSGVADAKKLERGAPAPRCATVEGLQWYTVKAPRRGPMLARLVARGDLDATLSVYRIVRSQRTPLTCASTTQDGRAHAAWYAYTSDSYLIGVGRRAGSATGTFSLTVDAAEPPPTLPGPALPPTGVWSTVNSALDSADAWAVSMQRGTTYRLNLTTPSTGTCIPYEVYRPGVQSLFGGQPVLNEECGGYAMFTPGIDGGGVYSVVVRSDHGPPITHGYGLQVAPAAADDTAPGVSMANGAFVSGSVSGQSIDAVDMYRFAVPREYQLTTVELSQQSKLGLDLLVLSETGGRVAAETSGNGRQALRLHMHPGRYYAVVRARGADSGSYGLQVRVRDVTSMTITSGGSQFLEVAPGSVVPLTVQVTSASHGGHLIVEIDHFDPLFGWHFDSAMPGRVDAGGVLTVAWTPPSVGVFRVRARFVANPYSSESSSSYVHIHVAEPLE